MINYILESNDDVLVSSSIDDKQKISLNAERVLYKLYSLITLEAFSDQSQRLSDNVRRVRVGFVGTVSVSYATSVGRTSRYTNNNTLFTVVHPRHVRNEMTMQNNDFMTNY